MAKTGYPPIVLTDTFADWLQRTNELTTDLATVIVTTNSTATGAATTGNASIGGNLDAVILSATELKGGTNTTTTPLKITSDVQVQGLLSVTQSSSLGGALTDINSINTTITGSVLTVDAASTFTQPIIGDITGSANTANALTTPRAITLDGAVTGTATFDGTSDIVISTTSTADALTDLLLVDGAGSGLDADLLDGLESTQFVRSDVSGAISGSLTTTSSDITDGTNTWSFTIVGGVLNISVNGTKLFKLDQSGNLTVKGDITAFGAV